MPRQPRFSISRTYDPSQWIVEHEESFPDGTRVFHFNNGMTVRVDMPPLTLEQEEMVAKRMSEISYKILARKCQAPKI